MDHYISDLEQTYSIVNRSFICPYPLVYADSSKDYQSEYTTHWAYKHGNCAVRCPTIVLTPEEFNTFNTNVMIVAMIAFILSTIVLAFHLPESSRYNIRIFFVAGFTGGSFAFTIFPLMNTDYRLICSPDRAHYIAQNPLCILQSTFIVFSYSWIALWGAIYSMDIYFVTSLTDPSFLKDLRKYYFWFALIFTIGITSAGLIADNYGYDYTTALPNCLYLFAQNETYFWTTLVLPYFISTVVCLLASFGSAYRLQSVFVNSKVSSRRRMLRSVMNTFNRNQGGQQSQQQQSLLQQQQSQQSQLQLSQQSIMNPITGQRRTMNLTSSESPAPSSGEVVDSLSLSGNDEILQQHEPSIEYRRDWSVDIENTSVRRQHDSVASHDGLIRTLSDSSSNPILNPNPTLSPVIVTTERHKLETVLERPSVGEPSSHTLVGILEKSTLPTSSYISSPSESSSQHMSSFNIELKEEQRNTDNTIPPEHENDYVVSIISEEYLSELRSSLPRLHSQYSTYRHDDPDASSHLQSAYSTPNNIEGEEMMIPESTANAFIRQISIKLSETWKYNGRIILFIFVYCLLSVYVIPVFVYLFHSTYNENVDSAEDFIACLITAAFTSPIQTQDYVNQYAKDTCGEHPSPRPPFGLMVSVNYWAAGFGIIPAIIFGSIFLEKFPKWFMNTWNRPLAAPLLR